MARVVPPRLPGWRPRNELSRPSAEELTRAENRKQTLTYAGFNSVIPIVYGEQIVGGPVIAGPAVSGNNLVYAIALCYAGHSGIERIMDARLGDSVTTVSPITNPEQGQNGSVGGVSFRVFDGRQTTPWSGLASAIPGFSDSFHGIAYAFISVSGSSFTGLPQVTFRQRGRKCYDPRFSAWAWTENPVLHMLDFVENDEFGMGASLIGAVEAADIADSPYSGIPRSRTGLTLQDPITEGDALALFSEYAEVLWSYDGRDVTIIPDAPTDTIHEIEASAIREGSLSLTTVGLEQVPTQVRIMFTDRNSDTSWVSIPATAEVAEHTMHGLPNSPSSVPLPGVFNRPEAERRALQRLRRLQAPGRIEFQMFASGLPYQAGDVVRLPDIRGLNSVDVRLTAQPEMVAPLLYQMAGEIYRESNYPESGDGIAIPTGSIAFYVENSPIPDGWEMVAGGGRLIREGAPGNAGNLSNISASASIVPAGGHYGQNPPGERVNRASLTGTGQYYYGAPIDYAPDHTHSASASASAVPTRQAVRLIRRVGSPTLLPAGAAFLGAEDLSSLNNIEYTQVGRFLAASDSTAGIISEAEGGQVATSMAPQHVHNNGNTWGISKNESLPKVSFMVGVASGGHTHSLSWEIVRTLRSYALALFYSDGQGTIPERGIVGWESELAPAGWAFCDGSNGTVDLRERFIYLTASANAGVEHQSENRATLSFYGSTTPGGSHAHIRHLLDNAVVFEGRGPQHTGVEPPHVHAAGGGNSVVTDNIVRYQLRLIQYIGG